VGAGEPTRPWDRLAVVRPGTHLAPDRAAPIAKWYTHVSVHSPMGKIQRSEPESSIHILPLFILDDYPEISTTCAGRELYDRFVAFNYATGQRDPDKFQIIEIQYM
jgi:hypothetical protein